MKKIHSAYYLYGILSIVYLALIFFTPVNQDIIDRYNVSASTVRLLLLTITLPLIGIWGAACYGYVKLSEYCRAIKGSKDGGPLSTIRNGIGLLALWLPATTIIGNALQKIARRTPDFQAEAVIIQNYLSLALLLAGFIVIYQGVSQLTNRAAQQITATKEWLFWALFVGASFLFVYLSLASPARQFPETPGGEAIYYLPDWLIVTTLIIPYLITWYIGLRAVFALDHYSDQLKGKLYVDFFKNISAGLGVIVIATMLLRFIDAVSGSFGSLSLVSTLVILYLLLIIGAIGYLFIARGAKRLKAIEEV